MIPALPALRDVVAELRTPLPVIPDAAALAFSVNDEADDAVKVIAPLKVSTALTAPVVLKVSFEAFSVLVPAKVIPPAPAVKLTVAELRAPAGTIPLAALFAFRVNEVPDEAFRLMVPALLSTTLTTPLEFAVSVEADTDAPVASTVMPPVPAVIVRVGLASVDVEEMLPVPAELALKVSEEVALSADVSVMFPLVAVRETLAALIYEPIFVDAMALLLLRLTAPLEPSPLTAFARVMAAPLEVSVTVPADMEPPVFVRLPEDDSVTAPMLPVAAARLPATFRVPAPTASAKVSALPAEEAFKVSAAAVSLLILTFPVELAARVVALIELREIPPLPAATVRVGVVTAADAVTEPDPLGLALNVMEFDAPVEVIAPSTVIFELVADAPPAVTLMFPAPVIMPVLTFPSADIDTD